MRRDIILILLALIWNTSALPQQPSYLITTIVGAARPVTPSPGSSFWAPANDITLDRAGAAYFSAPNWNAVFKLDNTGSVTLVAGTGDSAYSGDGGLAAGAALRLPRSGGGRFRLALHRRPG